MRGWRQHYVAGNNEQWHSVLNNEVELLVPETDLHGVKQLKG
jgi:hypothetical protein